MNLISLNMANYIDFPPYGKFINRNCHIGKQLDKQFVRGDYHIFVDFVPFGRRRQLKNLFKVRFQMSMFERVERGLWHEVFQVGKKQYVFLPWKSGRVSIHPRQGAVL